MELGSVVEFLENKTILVTGGTGFLAKIFLEKVLRVQPNVKKIYLLLRASDAKAAAVRFQNEIISKDLFKVLKEMWGVKFNSCISEKVSVIPGDITIDDLGVKDCDLKEQMLDQIDAIINLAATTKFDERYDVSLEINTLGAKHVVEFAKQCTKLKVLVHVSTAYVCGEKGGLIEERSYELGQTLNGASGLDIDAEVKLAHDKLKELSAMGSCPKEISTVMRDLGISRAKEYGWPNTYVFTKAMGEMLIGQSRSSLPVVISRPTIVSSTYSEPFPGWVEGVRTIDSIIVGYGKGKLQCFLCDPQGTFDLIPADMVVNSIIVAMAANAGRYRPDNEVIYQIGSSLGNPMRYCKLEEYGYRYFTEHPWINKEGKAVIVGRVKILSSMASFRQYMTLRYLLLLKGLEVANVAFCRFFQGTYVDMSRKINMIMRLIELYRPYLFFEGVFDDLNTEKLRAAIRLNGTEADMFNFDPKCIDWDDYFRRVHFRGLVKYVFK